MENYYDVDLYDSIHNYIGHYTIIASSREEARIKGIKMIEDMPKLFNEKVEPVVFVRQ